MLQKELHLTRVAFFSRDKDGLKGEGPGRVPSISLEDPIFQLLSRSPKPLTLPKKDKSIWLVFWPIWVGQELVACYALGPKRNGSPLSSDERKLMELLILRTTLFLKEARLWELIEAENRKSSLGFLSAGMLHEIRNPLTALNTLIQLLPQKKRDVAFMESFEKITSREIRRLIHITENILDILKPGIDLMAPVKLEDVVNHVVGLLTPLFATKKVELSVKQTSSLVLKGNEKQIEILVLNLLQNAFQAVPKGGKIRITTHLSRQKHSGKDPWIELRMKDNGKGISKENLDKIFEPFFSTRVDGMGLGLAICQKIIQNHEGYMGVKSSSGRGTTFTLCFPRFF